MIPDWVYPLLLVIDVLTLAGGIAFLVASFDRIGFWLSWIIIVSSLCGIVSAIMGIREGT